MPPPESSPGAGSLLAPLLCSPFLFNIGMVKPFMMGVKTSHSTFFPHSSLLALVSISVVMFFPLSPLSLKSLYFCPSTKISLWFLFLQLGIHCPVPLHPPSFPHHLAYVACTVPSDPPCPGVPFCCPFLPHPSSMHGPSLPRSLFHSL